MKQYKNTKWRHTYTEVDFFACLLIHGWDYESDFVSHYWPSVDEWFKQQWPDRWDTEEGICVRRKDGYNWPAYQGQMEFKLQFFDWVRNLHCIKNYADDHFHSPVMNLHSCVRFTRH